MFQLLCLLAVLFGNCICTLQFLHNNGRTLCYTVMSDFVQNSSDTLNLLPWYSVHLPASFLNLSSITSLLPMEHISLPTDGVPHQYCICKLVLIRHTGFLGGDLQAVPQHNRVLQRHSWMVWQPSGTTAYSCVVMSDCNDLLILAILPELR